VVDSYKIYQILRL